MKNRKFEKLGSFVALGLLGLSTAASAQLMAVGQEGKGFGPNGVYLKCGNPHQGTFEIRATAAPGYIQGVLDLNQSGRTLLSCTKMRAPTRSTGDRTSMLWDCKENRAGEGLLEVTVLSGGFAGRTFATVQRESALPSLPANGVLQLRCNR